MCEFARLEPDGKASLIGFFGSNKLALATEHLPSSINLSFVFVVQDGEGVFKCTSEVFAPDGHKLGESELPHVDKKSDGVATVIMTAPNFPVVAYGRYEIRVHLDDRTYVRDVEIRSPSAVGSGPR